MKTKTFHILTVAAALSFLSACGGGDGDGDSGTEPIAQSLPTVINGKARLLVGSLTGECGVIARNGALAFHKGELWIAERGCDGSSRVQVVNPDTGEVRTHVQVTSDLNNPRATGFMNPTGMAFDSNDNLYVADSANQHGRWSGAAVKPQIPGHSAGIWKINSNSMEILAGVVSLGDHDGTGDAASFISPNGLVASAGDSLYTKDEFNIRRIRPNGDVVTLGSTEANFSPLMVNSRGAIFEVRNSSTYNISASIMNSKLPENTVYNIFDSTDRIHTSDLPPSPDQPTGFSIYRGERSNSSNFDRVVDNVQYLSSFVVDGDGNIYIQQRNAIVKVEFN